MCPDRYLSLFVIVGFVRIVNAGIRCEVSRVVVHGSDTCLMSVCLFVSL